MDDLRRFCVRMLGEGSAAADAERSARTAGEGSVDRLRAAVIACRERFDDVTVRPHPGAAGELARAIAAELDLACSRLATEQREALALRELLGLSHQLIGTVLGLEPDEIPPLLAHARLALREQLRGDGGRGEPEAGGCAERDRALRTIALRQDGEPCPAADEDWLIEHLGHCRGCAQAHSAMLEAVACYRAWSTADRDAQAIATAGS